MYRPYGQGPLPAEGAGPGQRADLLCITCETLFPWAKSQSGNPEIMGARSLIAYKPEKATR